MKHLYFRSFLIVFTLFLHQSPLFAQCDINVPVFPVDFTGHPDSTWTINNVQRDGLCCSADPTDRCLEFIIIMDVNQQGIAMDSDGGPALGSGGILVECDDLNPYSFLDTICLSGIGPHHVTICKPGANKYDYSIRAIPKPSAGPPIAVSDGCTGIIYASGYVESSLVWTSLSPGATGAYNLYLSCTSGCDTTIVTAQPGYPDSVLYQVSGNPVGGCNTTTIKDSVWVYFVTDKMATINPQNPVICAGTTSAFLTANGSGGKPPYSYLWSTGATTQSITTGVGSFWVRISDVTTCPPVFDTVTVTSSATPVADFTFTNACANSGMSFIDASTIASGSITNWNWNFGDGNTSTAQNPVHVYAATGNYTVTFTSTALTGCADTVSKTVTVNPIPLASFTANAMCYIDSVSFTNTSTISSGSITSWNWYFGDGNTSTLQEPNHFYLVSGIQNVTLAATSALGCIDSSVVAVDIEPKPVADFTFSPACINTLIAFTDASSPLPPPASLTGWSWNFGDGNTSTLQNPTHSYAVSGSYTVTFITTAQSGCKDTVVKILDVSPSPVAAFTANAMCYIDSVAFTNSSSISSGTISSWDWDFGDGTTGTLQNPNHFYPASGNQTVTLVVTSALGCKDTSTVVTDVEPKPAADYTFPATCTNQSIIFTDASTISPPPASITSWSWDFGDSGTSSTQNASHVYTTDGNYTVTLITTAQSGCKDTVAKTLTVNPSPVAAFTANAMCYIDSVSFANSSSISSGTISSWNWDFGDGTNGTVQDPSHIYPASGNQTVVLIATSALGCKDTSTAIINVQPKPLADYTFPATCTNQSIIFTDASTISPPPANITGWSWDFGDSGTSSTQNASHVYTTEGNYTVTLITTAQSGCTDTIAKTLTVNPSPLAVFTANAMCYLDSVAFTNGSSISSGTISNWDWDFGDGTNGTVQDPNHFYPASGNQTVTLIATSALGCKDTSTVTIDVEPAPKVDFNFSSACTNTFVIFTDASTITPPPASITSWNWNFGDGNTSTSQNPSHNYPVAGNYTVTFIVTAQSGCVDSISKVISVNPGPVTAFTTSNPCYSDSVRFTDNSSISSGTVSNWDWNFGDSNTSTLQDPAHYYSTSGTYTIMLVTTSDMGCKDTASMTVNFSHILPGFTDNAPACQGVPISFTDTSFVDSGTTISNWDWNFGDSNTSTSQNPSHPYSAGGVYTVQLIVTATSGCADTVTHTVNIQGFPSANAGNDTSSCANNPGVVLNGNISNAGGEQWYGSGTFSNEFILNPSYTPSASAVNSGFDTLLLVTTSNAFCPADSDVVVISFYPGPTVNAGSNITVCKDTMSVPVCATITAATGGVWQTLGSGTFANDSLACTLYMPSTADTTAGSVTLVVTSTGNGTCFAETDTVVINFTPVQAVNITSNDSSCAGNPFGLGVNVTTGSGVWSSGGTGTFVPDNTTLNGVYYPSAADDAAGNVSIYFVSTNNAGCRAKRDTIDVTLIPSPVNAFSSTSACPTFPIVFTDATTSTVPVNGWNWNFGDGSANSTVQNPTHVYNAGGPYNVTLITTSVNGCVDTLYQVVNVYYKPVAGYDANGVCLVDGTQFTDTSSVTGSTITSWIWNFGDGSSLNTTQNPLHNYPSGGNYNASLIVQSAQGCIDTVVHPIGVLPGPVANFSVDDVTAHINQTVHFTDQSANAVAWAWDFGDSQADSASNLQNPSHIYLTGGYYDVCLYITDINGCTDTVCKQEIVSLPPVVPSGFTPNGDGENDVYYVYGGPFKTLEFKIYNNWGELIFVSDKQADGWDGKRKGIDQPIGVYVYVVDAVTDDGEEYHLSGDVTLLR